MIGMLVDLGRLCRKNNLHKAKTLEAARLGHHMTQTANNSATGCKVTAQRSGKWERTVISITYGENTIYRFSFIS